MKRLLATIRCDMRIQMRNGFYFATAFVVGAIALLLSQLPVERAQIDLRWLLPAVVLNDLVLTTFYFIGGLVLLEKGEGSLQAQVVTPLRTGEYLASKVVTLLIPALIENVLIVGMFSGFRFAALPLIAGIALAATIYSLAGFVAVVRYASINEYLLPSLVYAMLLAAPLGPYVSHWDHWLLYLLPMQAPLVMMQAAFHPVAAWQLFYGVVYAGLWIGLMYFWSQRAFARYITARTGAN